MIEGDEVWRRRGQSDSGGILDMGKGWREMCIGFFRRGAANGKRDQRFRAWEV